MEFGLRRRSPSVCSSASRCAKGARGLGGWQYQALAMALTYLSITVELIRSMTRRPRRIVVFARSDCCVVSFSWSAVASDLIMGLDHHRHRALRSVEDQPARADLRARSVSAAAVDAGRHRARRLPRRPRDGRGGPHLRRLRRRARAVVPRLPALRAAGARRDAEGTGGRGRSAPSTPPTMSRALAAWRQALALLPTGSVQHRRVLAKVQALSAHGVAGIAVRRRRRRRPAPAAPPRAAPPDRVGRSGRRARARSASCC